MDATTFTEQSVTTKMSMINDDEWDSGFSSQSPPSKSGSSFSDSGSELGALTGTNLSVLDIRSTSASLATSTGLATMILDGLTHKRAVFPASSARFDWEQNGSTSAFHLANKNVGTGDDSSGPTEDVPIRSIPTLVLYDDNGLELFNEITYVEEYYVTNAEIQILQESADEMMSKYVEDGGILVELGVGSMRKTRYFLDALVRQNKSATYYALDLSLQSLTSALTPLADAYPTVSFVGLLGTYDDSLAYFQTHIPRTLSTTRTLLWLGTSIGNSTREEATAFLSRVHESVLSPGDTILCGIDRRNPAATVKAAYDDPRGITRAFIMNGLMHVERVLNGTEGELFGESKFEYVSLYNELLGQHEAYYRSLEDQSVSFIVDGTSHTIEFIKGELICIEYSVKYDSSDIENLTRLSGLKWANEWRDQTGRYSVHCFKK